MAAPATATTVAITTPRTGTRATTRTTKTMAMSAVPKARRKRVALESMLYGYGDQSVFGQGGTAERTPPRERCGPSGARITTPRGGGGGGGGRGGGGEGGGRRPGGENSRVATPRQRRTAGGVAGCRRITPFQSPHPTINEEEDDDDDDDNEEDEGRGGGNGGTAGRRPSRLRQVPPICTLACGL